MPSHTGPHHGIKYGWNSGEDAWGDDMTTSLKHADAFLTRSVKSLTTNTPPAISDGVRYIVGPSPSGPWSGHAGQVATGDSLTSTWLFSVPEKGWDFYDEATGRTWRYNGSAWQPDASVQAGRFLTMQAAIDAAAALGGGEVVIPAGTWTSGTFPAFTGITIPDNVSVRGEGNRESVLSMAGQSTSNDAIKIEGSHVNVSNLRVIGQGSSGSGRGIFVGKTATTLKNIVIEKFYIQNTPSWAIEFGGDTSGVRITIMAEVRNGYIGGVLSNGAIKVNFGCTTITIHAINFDLSAKGGNGIVTIDSAWQTVIQRCTFEPTTDAGSYAIKYIMTTAVWLHGLVIKDNWFEDHSDPSLWPNGSTNPNYWIVLDVRTGGSAGQLIGVDILRNLFHRYPVGAPSNTKINVLDVYSDGNPSRGLCFADNLIRTGQSGAMPTADIQFDSHSHTLNIRDNRIWNANDGLMYAPTLSAASPGNVTRSHDGDGKRMRLLPQDHASIPSPLVGEICYHSSGSGTLNKLYVYTGSTWEMVTST